MRSAFSKRRPGKQTNRAFALDRVYPHMTNLTAQEQTRFRQLLAAYNVAFGEWSVQARLLQAIRSSSAPDSAALQQARADAENAQIAYRGSRDLLADFLLARHTASAALQGRDAKASAMDHRSRVERMAYSLWKGAGCPKGSAEADWYRAEQLIQCGSVPQKRKRKGRS